MKNRTKISIGIGLLAITGAYATVNFSEKILGKIESEVTRYKTKKVVRDKFNNNEKLLNIVDDLSDSELNSLNQIAKDVKNSREKVKQIGKKIKDTTGNVL
ncbi:MULTISPECIES: hypothetical protein [Enterococcus]|uniref:YtxH domain-containing protein n=1 Tax=Enterococcus alishanensis TaxID=1303817 RepID=A0ABS6TEX8_9ENTE|nr:hypothetical protein [Enterococcus alishanensis]MBV7391502.1 hypothetical protein [Enterococcus alishanensis]